MNISATEEFKDVMRAEGLQPPDYIEPGKLHRFSTNGVRADTSGWCKMFEDERGGVFGDWRSGKEQTWQAKHDRPQSPAEREAFRRKVEEDRQRRKQETEQKYRVAADQAAEYWKRCEEAVTHPYLERKGISAHGVRIYKGPFSINGTRCDGALVVPIRNKNADLCSLQFITADGTKLYLPNGEKSGCYFSIGKPDGIVHIVEGFATGASVQEATGQAVAVAFDTSGLLPVAQVMREKFSDARLVLCADNDQWTSGNPGVTKARAAAEAVGGLLVIPQFSNLEAKPTDLNDLHQLCGVDAVKDAICSAQPVAEIVPNAAPTQQRGPRLTLLSAADITPEPIDWLWQGWLASGKLHMLAGVPGTGKTTLALAASATLSLGGMWPDRTHSAKKSVVIWSGEDDPKDTLVPRLLAMGADMSRIRFVGTVSDDHQSRAFDPAEDMGLLQTAIHAIGDVGLLVVDPIVSAVAGDSHKNAEVRRSLQPLVDLAVTANCAVLGISHLTKNSQDRDPLERITGAGAFGALPRVAMLAAKKTEEDGSVSRFLVRAKSNIGPDGGGFVYHLEQTELASHAGIITSRITWGNWIEGTSREILADAEVDAGSEEQCERNDAVSFLGALLAKGPMTAGAIFKEAREAGYNDRSIQRASHKLKVARKKEGMDGGWIWELPPKATVRSHEGDEGASNQRLSPLSPSVSSSSANGSGVEVF